MDERRRINYDKEFRNIVHELITIDLFNHLKRGDLKKIFQLSLALGRNKGKKTEMGEGYSDIIRIRKQSSNNEVYYLIMSCAVADENSLNVLWNEDKEGNLIYDEKKFYQIAEEYAKTGIIELKEKYDNNEEILDKMEREAVEFHDAFFGEESYN